MALTIYLGYLVGLRSEGTLKTELKLGKYEGFKNNSLYNPKRTSSDPNGYWLSAPSGYGTMPMLCIENSSAEFMGFFSWDYSSKWCGVRPVVHLKENVQVEKRGNMYSLSV